MNTFQILGVKKISRPFEGKKVGVGEVVGKPIEILDFEIRDSKKKEGSKYLRMQVTFEGQKRYISTGGKWLMMVLEQVSKDDLPIETEICMTQGQGYFFKGTIEE